MQEPGEAHRVGESLARLEHRLGDVERAVTGARGTPAWRRVTDTEHRLPVTIAIVVMIVLQARVPDRLSLLSWWVLPAMETVILAMLVASNPRRIDQSTQLLRMLSLALVSLASLANAWAAASLVAGLVRGTEGKHA